MIEFYRILVVVLLAGDYALTVLVEMLNLRHMRETLPDEFVGFYDEEKYRQSQRYARENTVFGLVSGGVMTAVMVAAVLSGAFNVIDRFARSMEFGSIATGLVFAGAILVLAQLMSLPFSLYRTFVIEEKFGFNTTTPRTFALDFFKGILLTALIGGGILACVLWFFEQYQSAAWLYSWGAVTVLSVLLTFVAPVIIMPLFNKFIPLPDGELRRAIEAYARAENFKLQGIFTMDGSRRSTKANAFFTGFGRFKRIVLFDTLIARQTVAELVAVLAHEMGHFRKGHIRKMMALSIASTGLMFFLLSLFLNNRDLALAFGMEQVSVYASFLFFGFIYAPVTTLLSVAVHAVSRAHEYGADAYAARTTGGGEALITALKKLTVDNLGNLTPHPLKVFLEYSHPPVLDRIRALRDGTATTPAPAGTVS